MSNVHVEDEIEKYVSIYAIPIKLSCIYVKINFMNFNIVSE